MKMTCYRHKAPPNDYLQAYFSVTPVDKDGKCDYYIPVERLNENSRTES